MPSPYPLGVTIEVVRRVPDGRDVYGNTTYRQETAEISGVAFAPGFSQEETDGRQHTDAAATFYLPLNSGELGPVDAVRYQGQVWELTGQVQEYVSPFTGWRPGTIVMAQRTEG